MAAGAHPLLCQSSCPVSACEQSEAACFHLSGVGSVGWGLVGEAGGGGGQGPRPSRCALIKGS